MKMTIAAIAAAAAGLLAGAAPAAQAGTAYAGIYGADSAQRTSISLEIARSGRAEFALDLRYRCRSGRRFISSISTDETDGFRVRRDGWVIVREPWQTDGTDGPSTAVSAARYFTLDAQVTRGGWFGGTVSDTAVFFDEERNKVDRCETGKVKFRGRRA